MVQNFKGQLLPCIVISVDSNPPKKYYFNTPDILQRFTKEHRVVFQKSNPVFFFSRTDEHVLAGMPGLMCTLSDGEKASDAYVFGPRGITEYFDSFRYLMHYNLLQYGIANLFDQSRKRLLAFKNAADLTELQKDSALYYQILIDQNKYLEQRLQDKTPNFVNDPLA